MLVCVGVNVDEHADVCAYASGGQRSKSGSSSITLHLFVVRQGLSMRLELANLLRPAGQ